MSLASRAGDLYYSFRFVKLLTTPWEETEAYNLGIIDEKGKRIKSVKLDNSDKKAAYSTFVRLVFNIKRLLEKIPGGKNTLSSYAAALFLLKEEFGLSDKSINKILSHSGIDPLDLMAESNQWYVLGNKQLSPGIYRIKEEKELLDLLDEHARAKDQVRVQNNCFPIGSFYGIDIYEATHINTGKSIFITVGEIYK